MQIQLILSSKTWQARYPQAGSKTGWSEWGPMDRMEALRFVELGWSIQYVD